MLYQVFTVYIFNTGVGDVSLLPLAVSIGCTASLVLILTLLVD